MATDIGTLATKLTVNAQTMNSGLAQAEARLKQFAGTAGRLGGNAFQNFASGNSLGVFTSPLKAGISALPGGGTAASALDFGEKALGMWKETASRIAEVSKHSDRLGISYNNLLAYQNAAGDSGEAIGHVMAHVGRELADAAGGSEEAQKKFRRLGFSLSDVQRMAGEDRGKAFAEIGDKIGQLGTSAEKGLAAFKLGGKRGMEVADVWAKGSDGLTLFRERLDATGQSMSDVEARAVRLTKAMVKQNERMIQGAKDQLTVATAPILSGIMKDPAGLVMSGLLGGNAGSGIGAFAFGQAQKLFDEANKAEKSPAEIANEKLIESIEEYENALKRTIATIGMTADEIKRYDLQVLKATEDNLKLSDSLVAEKNAAVGTAEEMAKIFAHADKTIADMEDPLSKARDEIEKINRDLAGGFIGAGAANAAIGKIGQGLISASGETKLPSVALKDSAAANSIITQSKFNGGPQDPEIQVKNAVERLEKVALEQKTIQERIARALEKQPQLRQAGGGN